MYSGPDLHKGGVSPFGHPRINDRSHLPAAYRSVPRPSSPLGAKASTERPSHTHHALTARTQDQAADPDTSGTAPLPLRVQSDSDATPRHSQPGGKSARQALVTHQIRFTCQTTRNTPMAETMRVGFSGAAIPRLAPQNPFLMEAIGFEPTTPCLQSRRSPAELRPLTGTHQQANKPGPQVTDPRTHSPYGPGRT